MNQLKLLLASWCEYLLSVQSDDGGFICEACGFEHGRADNAVFPFLCMYSMTSDEKWLRAVKKLLFFRKKLTNEDGSVSNDFESPWKGITAFSTVGLYKAISYYGKIIPASLREELEKCFADSAEWVHGNIRPGFRANINYYCASAAVNAMYGVRYNNEEYLKSAEQMLDYCMSMFTENGILRGEGQPHEFITPGGCVPADIGYTVEESIPALTDAALLLKNENHLRSLAEYSVKLLEFMLPDGAWDNSFGSRNNKWTYYGSRTSSGCTGAFIVLGKYRNELFEAAFRNLNLMSECTVNGRLYGGREYDILSQKVCVHHNFSHALGLADAVSSGFDKKVLNGVKRKTENYYRYFSEINTYRIHFGKWIATITGNDYSTYTWKNGAAHASGGMLSLLYHEDRGPVIAGSVYEYKRTETNNMQFPEGDIPHRALIPRLETEIDGVNYSTSLCFDCRAEITENEDELTVVTETVPEDIEHNRIPDISACRFVYHFLHDCVKISVECDSLPESAKLVVPVISSSGATVNGNYAAKDKIFFLTGGFAADEYVFTGDNMSVSVIC